MMHPKKNAKKFVIANWKMYGNFEQNKILLNDYVKFLSHLKQTQVVVCAPYPYLAQLQNILQYTDIAWGAQNVAKNEVGPFTGEVSAEMLQDFGATYVIIGHSERSTAYCESDENIAQKFMTAKKYGITPILCVGETLIEREADIMEQVVGKQLDTIINLYGAKVFANSIVSYEPIWAIGTGLAASTEQVQSMHKFIRNKIIANNVELTNSVKILYGGSVNPQNAVQLLAMSEVDGGLIGRCSLNFTEFKGICHAAEVAL